MSEFARKAMMFVMCLFWTVGMIGWMLVQILKHGRQWFAHKERKEKPKVLDGWEHGQAKLTEVTLHYVTAGDHDKPLMVMLHGFPEFWYSWRYQLKHFQQNYRVIAVDMRGYGDSDKPTGLQHYKIQTLARDVKELIEFFGSDKAVVLCHDWGGAVGWRVAMEYPEVVHRFVVFNAPHPKAMGKLFQTSRRQLLKSWYMFFFQCPWLPEIDFKARDFKFMTQLFMGELAGIKNKRNFTDDDLEAWKYTFSQPGRVTPPLSYYRAAFQGKSVPIGMKQPVQPPTLIVWGTADHFLETELGPLSMTECREAELRQIDGASHWVQQDEPEKCNQFVDEFLAKHF